MENSRLEYKEIISKDNEKYLKEVVAFLNSGGGEILFGVNNEGLKIGLNPQKIDDDELRVTKSIFDNIAPRPIDYVTIDVIRKELLVSVKIANDSRKSEDMPFYLKNMEELLKGYLFVKEQQVFP